MSLHNQNPFKWRHFQSDIILLCVRWYLRYSLSYRDLEEMMLERGLQHDLPLGPALCSRVGTALSPSYEAHDRLLASRRDVHQSEKSVDLPLSSS
jgi:hypothetical protein